MKQIHTYILIAAGALLAGCNENIEEYSGEAGIYFAMSASQGGVDDSSLDYSSSSSIPFAVDNREDTVMMVRAKVIGGVAGHDRIVNVRVVEQEIKQNQAVVGHDFDPLQPVYYVKAGEVYAEIPIHFYKRDDLKNKERVLELELLPSDDFTTPMSVWLRPGGSDNNAVDVLHHRISISDKWIKLPGFNEYFFGKYSEKKNRLMCSLFNLTLKDFEKEMTTVRCRALATKFDQYLKEQDALGRTVYEDYTDATGSLVKMAVGLGINY